MNTTISISQNKLVALWSVLVILLLAVFVLLLKPEKREDVVFRGIAGGIPLLEAIDSKGIHTLIGFDAEGRMSGFEAGTGNAINVCDATAGAESNTLTANRSCEVSPEMLQQLSTCPTTCNVGGVLKCAHSYNGKKWRAYHSPPPPGGYHTECTS